MALALAFGFGVRAAVLAARGDGGVNVWMSGGAFLVAIALAVYLRKVRAKVRAEKP
jgi:hypothetical protein